jgi:DNA-binding transcriptional MerR regulator
LAGFSIGEVELLTGVKSHILRYWEEVTPALLPQKDMGGHRIYTQREVDIIRRLKYLIYTRGFTAEGAGRQIVREGEKMDVHAEALTAIRRCRANLNEAYVALKKKREAKRNPGIQEKADEKN